MGHNSTYGIINWQLAVPIGGVNNTYQQVAVWGTSATIANQLFFPQDITTVKNWWNENAKNNPDPKNNLIITSEINQARFSNAALATMPREPASTVINKLQALLALHNQPEPVIFDLEVETNPIIQSMIEEIEINQVEQIQVQPNNSLRNALLIGGALLLL